MPSSVTPHERQRTTYRVLMIAPTSFFADYGCHVRILEEVRVLQQLGHQVTVCTYHTGRDLPEVQILRTLSIPWRREYEVGSSRHKIGFDLLLSMRSLRAWFQVRPHIIHAHLHEGALIGWVLSKAFGTPLVFDFQGSLTGEMVDHGFLDPDGPYYGAAQHLERFIDHRAPQILTSSARAADLLQREFGCSPGKTTLVPDCVNTDAFIPPERDEAWRQYKRSWGIPTQSTVVMYLGLLAEYQGTDLLLAAAQMICAQRGDVHFVLAGYPNVERYRRLAQEYGIQNQVTFTGQVAYEHAPRILGLGDIAVSPKLSKTEGAGKLLNYMSMALPTVTFDNPVSHEYLGDLGVYAKAADAADLARRILELVDHGKLGQAIGQALRERAIAHYAWLQAGETIVALYDALTGRTAGVDGSHTQPAHSQDTTPACGR